MTGLENRESKKDTKMKVKSKGRRRREKNKRRWKGKEKSNKKSKVVNFKSKQACHKTVSHWLNAYFSEKIGSFAKPGLRVT